MANRYSLNIPEDLAKEVEKVANEMGVKPPDVFKRFIIFGLLVNSYDPENIEIYVRDGADAEWRHLIFNDPGVSEE